MFAHFGYFILFVFMCPVSPNHNSSFFGIYQKKPYKLIYDDAPVKVLGRNHGWDSLLSTNMPV